jgi:hypothetical protein
MDVPREPGHFRFFDPDQTYAPTRHTSHPLGHRSARPYSSGIQAMRIPSRIRLLPARNVGLPLYG